MKIIVQKFGGTSVASEESRLAVKNKIQQAIHNGYSPVVVVSAMGKTTNKLVELAKEISINPDKREYDVLLSTGEQISISLLAIAIQSLGYDAISFTGYQAGIKTKGIHSKSEIAGLRSSVDVEINDVLVDKLFLIKQKCSIKNKI